jgi:light-regulated signal transduction histidine kinase (bacteriophytochrome)
VLYVNRLVDGIDMEEYIGSSVFDWLPPNISQSLRDNMDIVQKTREPRFYENDYVEPKGQNHHFYHILSLVPTEEREKDIFVVISQETTDLKVMEKELRKQRDQLAAKNKELEQFAYIAAHDLQEPLRTVSGFAGLISEQYEGTFDEVGQEMFYYLRTAADRMSLLIKALLDYSLIGKERVFEDVDCSSIISDVLLDLEPRIQAANACVDVGELPCIQGVGAEFQVLFRNLLGNALKFARKGVPARVSVHAEESELEWLFSVRDNGIGIESQFLEQIFLIFQRLHPSHEFEGVGIGLAHCAKIVSLYGGRIWVESVVGEGSVFSFSIPKYSQTGVLVEGVEA